MKILVTGNRGFLGRHLVPELEKLGEVFVSNTSVANLLTYNEVWKEFQYQKFDYIFHLACKTKAGDYCLHHKGEQWEINQQLNTNILMYWKNFQPQAKMIAMGTSCSYDPFIVMKEDAYMRGEPDKGLYTYAMTKRMLLVGLQSYAEQYRLKYNYYIPSTLYGEDFDVEDSHFIFDLIKKIYNGKQHKTPVELWGDGHQKRELVYVKDAVKIMIDSLHLENEVLNIGSGEEYSIRKYANLICDIIGYDKDKIIYDESKYVGVMSKQLNMDKLKEQLPNFQSTILESGILKTINYYKEKIK